MFVAVNMLLIVEQEWVEYSPPLTSLAKWVELNPGRFAARVDLPNGSEHTYQRCYFS